jgi:DNA gyrase subunit B
LRDFLVTLDEYQQIFNRVLRWLRDPRVVEIVARPTLNLDTPEDFAGQQNLAELAEELKRAGFEPEVTADEERSAWKLVYRDSTNAPRVIDIELTTRPEYRRLRHFAKAIHDRNKPPFQILKNGQQDTRETWSELLEFIKGEGTRDYNVQRYKGLGEMNAEQLWATTMNAENRTLLRVELRDLVESDEIFSTLMGESVEDRRKFIEDNALDVRNLDV